MENTPPRRRNNRLAGFDDRGPGMNFVTPCAHLRQARFGRVIDGVMRPNPAGRMVIDAWLEISVSFPQAVLDCWVLMPNHFHGLLTFDA